MSGARDPWTAVVLAGGRGSRMGGMDKAAMLIDGRTALDLILETLDHQTPVVVAGPERPAARAVRFVREPVPFQGPVAGLAAALPQVRTPLLAVLAVDAPMSAALVPALVARLTAGAPSLDAVLAVDADGRRQPLCSAWRTPAMASALHRLPQVEGTSMRALVDLARTAEWSVPGEHGDLLTDIDTPGDLLGANRAARHRPRR